MRQRIEERRRREEEAEGLEATGQGKFAHCDKRLTFATLPLASGFLVLI